MLITATKQHKITGRQLITRNYPGMHAWVANSNGIRVRAWPSYLRPRTRPVRCDTQVGVYPVQTGGFNSLEPSGSFSCCFKQRYSYESTIIKQALMGLKLMEDIRAVTRPAQGSQTSTISIRQVSSLNNIVIKMLALY